VALASAEPYAVICISLQTDGWLGGLVARALNLRLNSREFKTRRPLALPGSDLGQVTHTYVPLLPSSITWYRCKSRGGNGRLWKRCGLPSIMPGASPLPAQDHGIGVSPPPVCTGMWGCPWGDTQQSYFACHLLGFFLLSCEQTKPSVL